jgi:hypothetical protein
VDSLAIAGVWKPAQQRTEPRSPQGAIGWTPFLFNQSRDRLFRITVEIVDATARFSTGLGVTA